MSKLRDSYHHIVCLLPVPHYLGNIKKGTTNKYDLVIKIASKHHRGSADGGGYGGGNFYEVSVTMPPSKVQKFRDELKNNQIRSRNCGPNKNE